MKETLVKIGKVASITMIILGLLAFLAPTFSERLLIWIMVIGLFVYGVEELLIYFKSPKNLRQGAMLASGILWVVFFFMCLSYAINTDATEKLIALGSFNVIIAVLISVSCIFNGVNRISLSGKAEELGLSKGRLMASGILDLLTGIIVMTYPIGSVITLEMVYGIFLVVGGISLYCRCK